MKLSTSLLAIVILACACGGGNGPQAKTSPTPIASPTETPSSEPSPSASPDVTPSQAPTPPPSPPPSVGSFGVLFGKSAGKFTISLIAGDGKVAASAQGDAPMSLFCSNGAAAALTQPVSTSDTRAYFMDASGVVRFLSPDGSTGRVGTLPVLGVARRSFFAVSPDDKRIAVAVVDFAAGASTKLYVEDLYTGAHHLDIFSESGAYTLWPVGWHDGDLVVAKVPACTQGGGLFCCGPQEFHVVDPATAVRKFTIGGSGCVIAGAVSPGGAACENSTFTEAKEINWQGGVFATFPIHAPTEVLISPDSIHNAQVNPGSNSTTLNYPIALQGMEACEWIDNTHLLAGGDAQHQPRVGNVTTRSVVPVAALGDCAGRIPGAL